MRLYGDLAEWWSVLRPPEEQAELAEVVLGLCDAVLGPLRSLLELGSGGGHLAVHVPADVEVVLVDRSAAMLRASEVLNPSRLHVKGDLRTLRLDRQFDAVLLHDAVMYMLTEGDLAAALAACFAHLRPGGLALVFPDLVREDFEPRTLRGSSLGHDGRAADLVERHFDPDPADSCFSVEFSATLREPGGRVRKVRETHEHGFFDRPTWARLVHDAGFELHWAELPEEMGISECFLLVRPAG
ncbi:MAG: SAM-dependent methyltransferase [Myxococcota bacterium]|jgi:SAM-dependent methyltransferase